MKTFAKQSNRDLSDVFNETALIMHLQPNVIEKDFWVCFLIDHIFNDCKYKDAFVFKGGTSLSKVYHVIERFSEDVDLILDWRKIIDDEINPWQERSRSKQDKFNKQIKSLRTEIKHMKIPVAALGEAYGKVELIEDLITNAEKLMYKDKQNFHNKYPIYSRR